MLFLSSDALVLCYALSVMVTPSFWPALDRLSLYLFSAYILQVPWMETLHVIDFSSPVGVS